MTRKGADGGGLCYGVIGEFCICLAPVKKGRSDCGTKSHSRKFTPEAEEVYASPSKPTSRGEVAFIAPMLNVEHVTSEDDVVFQDEEKTSLG